MNKKELEKCLDGQKTKGFVCISAKHLPKWFCKIRSENNE